MYCKIVLEPFKLTNSIRIKPLEDNHHLYLDCTYVLQKVDMYVCTIKHISSFLLNEIMRVPH